MRKARGIRITPEGYAVLALMDRGEYKPLTTKEARVRAAENARAIIAKKRSLGDRK